MQLFLSLPFNDAGRSLARRQLKVFFVLLAVLGFALFLAALQLHASFGFAVSAWSAHSAVLGKQLGIAALQSLVTAESAFRSYVLPVVTVLGTFLVLARHYRNIAFLAGTLAERDYRFSGEIRHSARVIVADSAKFLLFGQRVAIFACVLWALSIPARAALAILVSGVVLADSLLPEILTMLFLGVIQVLPYLPIGWSRTFPSMSLSTEDWVAHEEVMLSGHPMYPRTPIECERVLANACLARGPQ